MDTTSFPLQLLEHMHGTVAVVGSMNVDYTITTARLPEPGETVAGGPLELLPGGKSGNQAAAAALLGADVRMFGAVGSDSNADFLLDHLAAAGVDTSHVRHVDGPSGLTVITVDASAENTIVYSAGSNAQVSVDYVESKIGELTGADVLGLCLESPIETVTACARMCHEAGVRVLLNDSPFTADLPAELIEHTDILLVNEIEMAQLLDLQPPADDDWSAFDWPLALERLEALGIRQAVVTLGADGSVVLDATADEHVTRIAPVRVDAVDTTGCDVRMFGAVGSDSNADFLLDHLAAAGVDTSHVRHVDGPSGLTVITVDASAENTIVYSAGSNAQVSVDYVESKIGELTGADVLGLCLESPIETVTACARMCHEAGVRVLLNDSPFTADLPEELIEHTDILLVNEIEMAQLLDLQAPADDDWSAFDWPLALERLEALGIRQAVVTLGADGSVVLDATADEHVTRIAPVRVDAVDTTGCGDSFMGTVLAGLASGWSLAASARAAAYVSAYAASGRGAQASYGTPAQIRAKFEA